MASLFVVLALVVLGSISIAANCPGHLKCSAIQDCPRSKNLTEMILEAHENRDFGNLGRYALELDEMPKCGNSGVCCQLEQQGLGKN